MIAAALWFGCTAWLRPLAIPDEGRYVGVAWEMLTRRDWLVPTLDGLPFFHKPPLFYWITATAMASFGPTVAAARFAPWLACVASVTGLFAFVRQWFGSRRAWATAVVFVTAPLSYGAAQYANMDALVAACISGAILFIAHATLRRSEGGPYRRALSLGFVAMALGILSKGLIGIVLPILVLLVWGSTTRRLGKIVAMLCWAPGWILASVIALPWFILIQQRHPAFAHYFVVVQHFERFATGGFNNQQPWWFYLAALTFLMLPWSAWVPVRRWQRLRNREAVAPSQPRSVRTDLRWLMGIWLAVITLFFSLPSSKLVGYILPALPPLAFILAGAIGSAPGRIGTRIRTATLTIAGSLCIAAPIAAHYFQPKSNQLIAERLRELRRSGEPVWFIDRYYYDLAFYAQLESPPWVVAGWKPADVAQDSWQRELVDAAAFAPAPDARHLLAPDALRASLCRARAGWLVGPRHGASVPESLASQAPDYLAGDTALWHVPTVDPAWRSALNCDPAEAHDAR